MGGQGWDLVAKLGCMDSTFRVLVIGCVLLVASMFGAGAVCAQSGGGASDAVAGRPIDFGVLPENVGLGGVLRGGEWTPMKLTLRNATAAPRQLRCEWLVDDIDGDTVSAHRRVTISPNRTQEVWLYAALPVNLDAKPIWSVRVVDEVTGELLGVEKIRPGSQPITPESGAIGIVGSASMGLENYLTTHTQHERIALVKGLSVNMLPDRWYGYDLLDTLVWTPGGGSVGISGSDPSDAGFSSEAQAALREWIRRGGHLVVVLPAVGGTWYDSPLADLLPALEMERVDDAPVPSWVGSPVPLPDDLTLTHHVFAEPSVGQESYVSVLLREDGFNVAGPGRPMVVRQQVGTGAVTVVGLDLSDPRFPRQVIALPNGSRLWRAILGWQSPAWTQQVLDDHVRNRTMTNPDFRDMVYQGEFVPRLIAMQRTASVALGVAIVLFVIYWLLAGPVGHVVLKSRGWLRHSWLIFFVVVLGFTVIAWSGAWLARPATAAISHVSVVTYDMTRMQGFSRMPTRMHAHSWFTLYWPNHGEARLRIGGGEDEDMATPGGDQAIACVGLPGEQVVPFLTSQRYAIDSADPSSVSTPMRAAAKMFEADYYGLAPEDWIVPQASPVHVDARGKITGNLTHFLPGDLINVLVVYCPGDGRSPWVWRAKKSWQASPEVLDLSQALGDSDVLLVGSRSEWDGYLNDLIRRGTPGGNLVADTHKLIQPDTAVVTSMIEALSFYSMLPPPNYWDVSFSDRTRMLIRDTGREFDMTPLLSARRLIIMGHLRDGPLPTPVTAQGDVPPASGWTAVRFVVPIEPTISGDQ